MPAKPPTPGANSSGQRGAPTPHRYSETWGSVTLLRTKSLRLWVLTIERQGWCNQYRMGPENSPPQKGGDGGATPEVRAESAPAENHGPRQKPQKTRGNSLTSHQAPHSFGGGVGKGKRRKEGKWRHKSRDFGQEFKQEFHQQIRPGGVSLPTQELTKPVGRFEGSSEPSRPRGREAS